MEQVQAYHNHGHWIVDCPNCPSATAVKIGDELVMCGCCYPDKRAKKWELLPNGKPFQVSDKNKQDASKAEAWARGEVYEIIFPDDAKSAEKVLRLRKAEHQNYLPWKESLSDLEKENKEHPKLKYLWDKEENEKYQEEIKPKEILEIAELSNKELRRIK